MSDTIKGLYNQEILNLPHPILYCDNHSDHSPCMQEVKRTENSITCKCTGGCNVEMVSIHDGSKLIERIFYRGGKVVDRKSIENVQLLSCKNCGDTVKGLTDTYYCDHCDLPLCRRIACIDAHRVPCEAERRAVVGDTVVDEEKKQTHRSNDSYHKAQERAWEREGMKS
jgi:hypothetical protein